MSKTEAAESRRRMWQSMAVIAAAKPITEISEVFTPSETKDIEDLLCFTCIKAAQWLNACAYVEANGGDE